jgi:exodeoxyribonuclease V
MLKDFVYTLFENNLIFNPTETQKKALDKIADFICSDQADVFLLTGYAGTGKTTIISTITKSLKTLKIKTLLLAPTGRAAKVISSYSNERATTIHKKIFKLNSLSTSNKKFLLNDNLHSNTLFIIDEASLIADNYSDNNIFGSGRLLEDVFTYIQSGKNCKLLLIGDLAQLPPIGTNISPALDFDYLSRYTQKNCISSSLTDVVRQSHNSGILYNATTFRNLISENIPTMPKIKTTDFTDILQVGGADLIECISTSYDTVGIENTIIITRSNKRANKFNEGIRRSVLWQEEQISIGDQLMIVKNNYFGLDEFDNIDFIANGDSAKITRIKKYEHIHNLEFANVSILLNDYNDIEIDTKIIINTLNSETPALSQDQNNDLYNSVAMDYADIQNKKERYEKIKSDPYFNALQVKFAYAITCHKAQGGQWEHVYIDHGYLPDDILDVETIKWLYTAITRAKSKVFLVNFKKDFFDE